MDTDILQRGTTGGSAFGSLITNKCRTHLPCLPGNVPIRALLCNPG